MSYLISAGYFQCLFVFLIGFYEIFHRPVVGCRFFEISREKTGWYFPFPAMVVDTLAAHPFSRTIRIAAGTILQVLFFLTFHIYFFNKLILNKPMAPSFFF
jgi:hypothetical protein